MNPTSRWIVTAVSGAVALTTAAGGSWDIGSPPDPYLCLTLEGVQSCTEYVSDTYTPRWTTRARFPATTASALMAGVQSAFSDDDVGFDDPICPAGPVRFSAANFNGAPVVFGCGSTASFTVTLTPAP